MSFEESGVLAEAGTAQTDGDMRTKGLAATASVLGAIGASACCIVPLALFSVGIGGAWISNLTAMYPYKWFIIVPTLAVLAYGFYLVYRAPKAACDIDAACARPISDRIMKSSLWLATLLVGAAMVFPYVAPYLLNV